jgi:hypothetical protein
MTIHHYKEYTIKLSVSAEGIMWACQYVILKSGQKKTDGFPDGNTFDSVEKAESAALEKAKSLIDNLELDKDP